MTFWANLVAKATLTAKDFTDRRPLRQIGGCWRIYHYTYIGKPWETRCSCGKRIPDRHYARHQTLSGLRAYLRQVWASLKFWLKGPA